MPKDTALLTIGVDCVWEPQSIYRKYYIYILFIENALFNTVQEPLQPTLPAQLEKVLVAFVQ